MTQQDPGQPGAGAPTSSGPLPGWYPDPWFTGQRRWFTGSEWSADVVVDGIGEPRPTTASPGPPPHQRAHPSPPPPQWGAQSPPPPAWPGSSVPAAPAPLASRRTAPWAIASIVGVAALIVLIAWVLRPDAMSSAADASGSPTPAAPTAPATPAPPSPTAPASPAPASPTPGPSGGSSAPVAPADVLLENLVVRQRDVPPDNYLVATIPDGTLIGDQGVTLDLCDATYPSEDLREQRLQVAATDLRTLDTTLSTEAVRYRSADATAQAFEEVKAAAAACPTGPQPDDQGGTVTTTITPDADADWPRTPGVDRLAYRVERTYADGTTTSSVVAYLKRGPLFIGVYFPQPDGEQMAVEGATTVPGIVKVFEERLLNPPTDAPDPIPDSGGGGGGLPA